MRPKPNIYLLAALSVAVAGLAYAGNLTVSVDFGGRDAAAGNPSTPPLAPTAVAGVVAVPNWNLVDDAYGFTPANVGTTTNLFDSTGARQPVTLTFSAGDSWYNDVDITGGGLSTNVLTDPNALMMNGIIKDPTGTTGFFKFNNLPEGTYDLYVYVNANSALGVGVKLWDWDGVSTNYIVEQHTFTNTQAFVEAHNTNPSLALWPVGNYVHLTGLGTYGRGAVGFYSQKFGPDGDGVGIAGLQVVQTGPATANTLPPQVFNTGGHHRVAAGSTYATSVTVQGPVTSQGWYKNGSPIPGANSTTYSIASVDSTDNASFTFVAANNVGSVTSAPVVLTVGKSYLIKGELLDQIWYNRSTPGDLTGALIPGLLDGVTPGYSAFVSSAAGPVNDGINNYVQRLSGYFIPPTSGSYVFFDTSDDNSELFLSTDNTPANKYLIAEETQWSNANEWTTDQAGGDATTKRSDQFGGTAWPTGNIINLQGGHSYYIEADMEQGGGGDNLGVYYKLAADPDPSDGDATTMTGNVIAYAAVDGTTVTFTAQPQSSYTVSQAQSLSLTLAGASSLMGDDAVNPTPISITWQAQAPGAGGFTNIPGAVANGAPVSSTLNIPSLKLTDNGTVYKALVVAGDFSATIGPITVSVIPDTTPPQVVSVGAVNHLMTNPTNALPTDPTAIEVDIIVNKPLTASTSLNLANFALSHGTVTAARYETNSSGLDSLQTAVVLSTTGLTNGGSYNLTVGGLVDYLGNVQTTPATAAFTVSKMTWVKLGYSLYDYTQPEGSGNNLENDAYSVDSNGGFNIVSGGDHFWGTEDDITFVYEPVTGDFDKVVQVEYTDPASHWARTGLSVRQSLASVGADPTTGASLYQSIISDPLAQEDTSADTNGDTPSGTYGVAGNSQYETNLRISTGAATSSARGSGDYAAIVNGQPVQNPVYPNNSWVRLQRQGDYVSTFFSHDGVTWKPLGITDFTQGGMVPSPALPPTMYVGMMYSPENDNIYDPMTTDPAFANFRKSFAARVRNYGDFKPSKPEGKQTYAIGVHFTDTQEGGVVPPDDVAGVDAVAQSKWNSVVPAVDVSTAPLALNADVGGSSVATSAMVDWSGSPNTWTTTGRGEENDAMTGGDALLMSGYLDTGSPNTQDVHFASIPSQLTSRGYDVVVYAQPSVASRGGGYRLLKGNAMAGAGGTQLHDYFLLQSGTFLTNWVQVTTVAGTNAFLDWQDYGVGNFIVFTNVTANEITIESTTDVDAATGLTLGYGGTPRAPIQAIQLVSPSGLIVPPLVVVTPTLSIAPNSDGNPVITFTGVLQSGPSVTGPFTAVAGATSPYSPPLNGAAANVFYRASSN